jgi:hypothetical protein
MIGDRNEQSLILRAMVNGIGRALRGEFEREEALPERFRLLLAELEAKVKRE